MRSDASYILTWAEIDAKLKNKNKAHILTKSVNSPVIHRGVVRVFPWAAQVIVFIEKGSLPVDRLRRTSDCYIEVKQKGEGWAPGYLPPTPLATALIHIPFMTIEPLLRKPYTRLLK